MITPDPPLAKALTGVVMDTIERSRIISSAALEEVILSKLLFVNATQEMRSGGAVGDRALMVAARRLITALCTDPHYVHPSKAVVEASSDIDKMLRERGA